ncbi:hypothetical protein NC651_003673 [Populus alba x Populus x berolinensis]|nr:hypothetical protein NC651_003673 [Populus alba x Populus x berolinensis]
MPERTNSIINTSNISLRRKISKHTIHCFKLVFFLLFSNILIY